MDILEAKEFYINEITKELNDIKTYVKQNDCDPEAYFKLEDIVRKHNIEECTLLDLKEFYEVFIEVKTETFKENEKFNKLTASNLFIQIMVFICLNFIAVSIAAFIVTFIRRLFLFL